MSATIMWQPVAGSSIEGGGILGDLLERLGGAGPWEMTGCDVPRLEGAMAADAGLQKPLADLIDAIHKHGFIRVWRQW